VIPGEKDRWTGWLFQRENENVKEGADKRGKNQGKRWPVIHPRKETKFWRKDPTTRGREEERVN